jgi:hypothetical protein
MKYEETYYGHRIVVTTVKNAGGRWTSSVEALDAQPTATDPDEESGAEFSSAEDARRAALSRAVGLLDRARRGQGKP